MQCKYCGTDGLHWEGIKNVWNLHEPDGDYHQCSQDERKKYTEKLEKEEKAKKIAAEEYLPGKDNVDLGDALDIVDVCLKEE